MGVGMCNNRPSRKGNDVETGTGEIENNFTCSHEIGHIVVIFM